MLKMKTDGREVGGTLPEQFRREVLQQQPGFFSRLHQCVSNRLKNTGNTFHGPAKPRLR